MMPGGDDPAPGTAARAMLPPDLNLFLSAGVGVERNGMTLTVLSALARLDLDPWDEARRLSKLSRTEAADSLSRTLGSLSAMPRMLPGTAARLGALLPPGRRLRPALIAQPPTLTSLQAVQRRAARLALLVLVVVLTLWLVGHWAAAAAAGMGAAAPVHRMHPHHGLQTQAVAAKDLEARPDLTPWLAEVFVHPAFRGRGYATALVRRVEAFATAASPQDVWLCTWTAEPLYARLGWHRVGLEQNRGSAVMLTRRYFGFVIK